MLLASAVDTFNGDIMTPKEAIEFFERVREDYRVYLARDKDVSKNQAAYFDTICEDAMETLQRLAAIERQFTPRTKPPTVEEVPDDTECFVKYPLGRWATNSGENVRALWGRWYNAWLPLPEVAL
jgi:hypothetical protein